MYKIEIERETAQDGPIVNEMLRCDIYEAPAELRDEDFRISPAYLCCPYCSRVGETLEDIPHEDGCPLAPPKPS